ncbi:MAG: hypothetical protein IH831_04040 [Planctomycetes bacterium]|nr:hypothetical protein [Planctomycetota bacterium]
MTETEAAPAPPNARLVQLLVLATMSTICYVAVYLWSGTFGDATPRDERMTLAVLTALGAAFVLYWLAIVVATRTPPSRLLMGIIVGGACLFRVVLLPSTPIHEIDIYRYLWDGAVLAEGVSPYRYPPQQVLRAADQPSDQIDADLRRLVELRERSASLAHSLKQIHYGQLPSPYPPVSQAVFALSAVLTPDAASPHSRLVLMKGLLVLFDVATLLVVIGLLKEVGMHPGWSVAYAWCPLLMKEFANSGHLDTIAIFFTTLTVWLLVRTNRTQARPNVPGAVLVGGVLALAIGAKLYPVVLAPLAAAVWWKRGGVRTAVVGMFATAIVAASVLSPMFRSLSDSRDQALPGQANSVEDAAVVPSAGIRAFLHEWAMNALLFMVVRENLRPQADKPSHEKPWFVVVPDSWSRAVLTLRAEDSPGALKQASFLLARIITGGVFLVLAVWLAWRAAKQEDGRQWCRAGMLTLAWFWLLCPTQNPWYWCWVLPLIPFARYRTWYVVGACVLLYYGRFWLVTHCASPPVLGTPYDGANFFDLVVVWLEFAPCLLALAAEWWFARRQDGGSLWPR